MHRGIRARLPVFSITPIIRYSPDNAASASQTSGVAMAGDPETFFARLEEFSPSHAAPIVETSDEARFRHAEHAWLDSSRIRDPAFRLSASRGDASTRETSVLSAADYFLVFRSDSAEHALNRIPYERCRVAVCTGWPRFRSQRYCHLRSGRKWLPRQRHLIRTSFLRESPSKWHFQPGNECFGIAA